MNRFVLLFISIFSFQFTAPVFGQQIDSIVVTPKGIVSPSDTVKIFIYTVFTSGGCAGTATYGQSGFTINASSLHCVGPLAVICHDVDTVVLNPPHTIGTYTFNYELSSGFGMPCTPGIIPDDSDKANFTVSTMPPVDVPPVISPIADDTICNNDSMYFKIFNVMDDDLFSVVVTGRSSNQSIIPDSNVLITPGGFAFSVQAIPLPATKGNVTLTITAVDSSNQKDSTTFDLLVQDCQVGIVESTQSHLTIFPNPANGDFQLRWSKSYAYIQLRMLNTLGEEVLNQSFNNASSVAISEILPSGLYYLIMELDGQKEVRTLVVED